MIGRERFTLIFPLVFAFFGGGLFFLGLLVVVLLVGLGDEPESYLEFGIVCVVVGFSLIYTAYRELESLLPVTLISFGSGLSFLGAIILLVISVTGDAPYPVPHIGAGLLLGGLFLVYIGYRKLTQKLMEIENQLVRY